MSEETPPTRRDVLKQVASATALGVLGAQKTSAATAADVIIDSHVHVWKNDPRYPWPKELARPPKEDALPSQLLALMDAHGVAKTVIVHVIYYRWDCRYAADTIKEHPARFQGVCRVDPTADRAPEDLARWVRESGFHGVRLSPSAGRDGDWIRDLKRMDAICSRAAELGVPLCVLCPVGRLPDVERLIDRHKERLDVCIDHMADCPIDRPEELSKLLALARYPRVYVKISHLWTLSKQPYPYRDTFDQVHRLYDAFGRERLMWGTDWPGVEEHCGYAKALDLYRKEIPFFSDEDRRWILGQTALKLWPFPQA
ncbi:MAG TPA: amidohydrolase family protein [Isosphaeraceae bacterium]|jgi:predicted TIM-barrel fold metal-dependent hydrolase|nr:amidohydrolase family protein [Isosphaeraceae bacterium]